MYVTGEEKYLWSWPCRESNQQPSAKKSNTLPCRHKSWLVPQGSASVLYTFTLWHVPLHIEIRPQISGSTRITGDSKRFNAHVGYLGWAPNVTGEEKYLGSWPGRGSNPWPSAQKSNTLPCCHKSQLVLQGSTSVLYTFSLWHVYPSEPQFYCIKVGLEGV